MANHFSRQPPSGPIAPDNMANDPKRYVEGYPKLAYFFSQYPRYFHLRSFSALSARVQLYRQHELVVLEKRLLELEGEGFASKSLTCNDYARLKDGTVEENGRYGEQRELYKIIKDELKEYEESLLRSSLLLSKSCDDSALRDTQRILAQKEVCGVSLQGIDANIWGSVAYPSKHASDLIQVYQTVEPSITGKFLNNKFLRWVPRFPQWLRFVLFWSNKQPDVFNQYNYSAQVFENVALALGNIVTSLLVYAAVTLLYLSAGRAMKMITVILIAVVVTVCTILFRNQQFVAMLATVCAVLVTLLANDSTSDSGRQN